MRFVINLLLCIGIVCGLGYIMYADSTDDTDVLVSRAVTVRLQASQSDRKQDASTPGIDINLTCLVWGPFKTQSLAAVQPVLDRTGLMEHAAIVDRYLPDRWIVYLGRFNNETAVKAFMKQFRQQGVKTARPIVRGNLAYGVEVATFSSQEDATAFLSSPKAPDISGMRVTNRLGEPSNEVDLVFNGLTLEQKDQLVKMAAKRPATRLQNCDYYIEQHSTRAADANL